MIGVPGHFSMLGLAQIPDNGFWESGKNLLYVHRGQGSRFLLGNVFLRLGIPAEKSAMTLGCMQMS